MNWEELENESTETLIEYIRWRNDPQWAVTSQNAFQAFCFRFQKDLAFKCRIICRNQHYESDIADDLAQRTFERFWKYPKFDFKKRKTAKDVDTAVRFYLYGIAQKQLYNLLDEEENPNPYTGGEEATDKLTQIDTSGMTAEQRKIVREKYELINKALDRLGSKHRIIYCTYALYQKKGVKMPRHLTEKLRTNLELTQATIQFYKKQATDKIEEYIKIYDLKYGK
jgi:DNA-directed RNA polymerase specialized sigma24 family protein